MEVLLIWIAKALLLFGAILAVCLVVGVITMGAQPANKPLRRFVVFYDGGKEEVMANRVIEAGAGSLVFQNERHSASGMFEPIRTNVAYFAPGAWHRVEEK